MEISLTNRARIVARAFYRAFDDYRAGEEYWVDTDYVYDGSVIARAYHDEKFYRVDYTFEPGADHGQGFDERVTFAAKEAWQEVTWEWTPVERAVLAAQKRALLDAPIEAQMEEQSRRMGGGATLSGLRIGEEQTRAFHATVKRDASGTRTTVIINTADVDQHRTIIDPAGGEWDEFRGKFFINHDLNLLAGRSPLPQLRGGNWVVQVEDAAWDHDDPEAVRWFNKVKSGLCDEVSIRMRPLDGRWESIQHDDGTEERVFRYTRWKGIEWSWVGMGSNPGSVVTERAASGQAAALERRIAALEQHLAGTTRAVPADALPSGTLPSGTLPSGTPPADAATSADAPAADQSRTLEEVRKDSPGAERSAASTNADAAADADQALTAPEPTARAQPATRPATESEYRALVAQMLPSIAQAVDDRIDRMTGRA